MWKLIRYRRLQALSIALLAALITTCAVFAPLYDRATQQALVDVRLAQAPVEVSGLSLRSSAPPPGNYFTGQEAGEPLTLEELTGLVGPGVRHRFRPAVPSLGAEADVFPDTNTSAIGDVLWRGGACRHVVTVQGRCPRRAGELMVSAADRRIFDYQVGTRIRVAGDVLDPNAPPATATLTVVGVYRQSGDEYWFGRLLTGRSGILAGRPPAHLLHDTWLTARVTFETPAIPALPALSSAVDLPLDQPRTGIDQLVRLGPQVTHLQRTAEREAASGRLVRTFTGLPELSKEIDDERAQSGVTIPLLMLQLGLLAVVVLWLVLAAATEQRRPEVALALLRGRGPSGARRLLLRELVPVALVGVPTGAAVALLLCWAARWLFLAGAAPFEIPPAAVVAMLGAAAVLVTLTLLAVRRVTREPVESLLRRVPRRATGWSLGVLETLVIAASGTAVVAFVTGGLSGPIALAAPALLALLVGLLVAHATVPVAAAVGNRLLRRGRVRLGVSVLDAARTPAAGRTVAILTVATALLVFSADALVVGARNRDAAAEQVAGAPQVAAVLDADLVAVRKVLRSLDPQGRTVTPVVRLRPPARQAPVTLAVVPDQFRHIAMFPGQEASRIPWQVLAPPSQSPITVRGTRITGRLSGQGLTVTGPGGTVAPTVTLGLVGLSNGRSSAPLGSIATGNHSRTFNAAISCRDGCLISGITVGVSPGSSITGTLGLAGLATERGPLRLGPASQWNSVKDRTTGTLTVTSPSADTLHIRLRTLGNNTVTAHQAWFPTRVPAIVAGRLPAGSDGDDFLAAGLAGDTQDARREARVPRVPTGPPDKAMVNLDVVQRDSGVDPDAQVMLWFAREDPAALARVSKALTAKGISLGDVHTLSEARRTYDESTAAWSLQLAVVVGVAGLLTGILVLLVIAVTGWRLRSRDFAALRMSGLSRRELRRIAVAEQLIAILLAVVAGVVCGAVGAHYALPTLPLFATDPEVSTLDLSTAWGAVAIGFGGALLVLTVTGVLIGRTIARRSTLERVREAM